MAVLIPALVSLRAAFDALAPDRDRRSDGWIGDAAHQREVSDHNPDESGSVPIHDSDRVDEVHAIDVGADLGPDVTMAEVVNYIIDRCRSGAERRLRYVIYDGLIWQARNGWRPAPYTGSDRHTGHAHFSASYDSVLEASTISWHLEDLVALSEQDKKWITGEFERLFARTQQPNGGGVTSRIGRDALDQGIPNPLRPNAPKTPAWMLLGDMAAALKEMADRGEI